MSRTPKYAVIKIKNKSKSTQTTKKEAKKQLLKEEIKMQKKKKVEINRKLIQLHKNIFNTYTPETERNGKNIKHGHQKGN